MTTPELLVAVSDLRLERGGRVLLHDFDLQVQAGELVLVEGANGAGKTTLLRHLAGLSTLGQGGEIRRHASSVLYLGHRAGVKQLLSARENLRWYCRAFGYDDQGIDRALEQVGLYGYEDEQCQNMSAGQQRRVNLARLYLSKDQLWLLDEPFTAIDRAGVAALTATIVARVGAGGAVVMTSHQELPLDVPLRRVQLGVPQ